ncbi:hypothetical protein BXZ70DRAFT_81018 [Cristinia sonorae]|uniref:BTB domain-containing protein n=1 Tax=Cristinia sonorae TaxID=1940300 RepID=A0A8K0UQ32_9AGAR|nr:hypothetical protein BXZ70DRAFT_81018 [Cristinia sonorae]
MYTDGYASKGKRPSKARKLASMPKEDSGPSSPPSTTPTIPSHIAQSNLMQTAVKMSLTSGTFIDTKLYAFSRRTSTGRVDTPVPIFANSSILRAASPYFEALLTRGFEENRLVNIDDGFPADRPSVNDSYDYDSDSDLEDDDDLDATTEVASLGLNSDVGDASQSPPDTVDGSSSSEKKGKSVTRDPFEFKAGRLGRVIHMPDTAQTTLKAFIFFLYTGQVAFKPLKSSPKTESASAASEVSPQAFSCSPKSLYRLADRYSHQGLKERCMAEIQRQLNVQNIMREMFSNFTSRYPTDPGRRAKLPTQ